MEFRDFTGLQCVRGGARGLRLDQSPGGGGVDAGEFIVGAVARAHFANLRSLQHVILEHVIRGAQCPHCLTAHVA